MNYEEQIKQLEDIIQKLESGEAGFDQAVEMYQKGADLCKTLSKSLDEAKGKITVIREELMGLVKEESLFDN